MKPSRYIKNTNYSTLAQTDRAVLTLSIPANISANESGEITYNTNSDYPIFDYSFFGACPYGSTSQNIVINSNAVVWRRDAQYPTTMRGAIEISVSMRGSRTIVCSWRNGDRAVIGDSSDNITIKITFYEDPFTT